MRDFIDQVEGELSDVIVVADMEAGLEHLSIGTLRYIDLLLVVVQPTIKTMLTADRTYRLALELSIPKVAFLANRIRSQRDLDQMAAFAREHDSELLIAIPEDDSVRVADTRNMCILDVAPESSTVHAIGHLADTLESQFFSTAPAG